MMKKEAKLISKQLEELKTNSINAFQNFYSNLNLETTYVDDGIVRNGFENITKLLQESKAYKFQEIKDMIKLIKKDQYLKKQQ